MMKPGGTYGAAMALEDAVVLGTLFSHLSSWDQVSTFLNAYQEIRQERTTFVNNMDISNAAFVRLPPGPQCDARNANISLAVDDWNDEAIRREFEGLVGLFGYEAEDAAHVGTTVVWSRAHTHQRSRNGGLRGDVMAASPAPLPRCVSRHRLCCTKIYLLHPCSLIVSFHLLFSSSVHYDTT